MRILTGIMFAYLVTFALADGEDEGEDGGEDGGDDSPAFNISSVTTMLVNGEDSNALAALLTAHGEGNLEADAVLTWFAGLTAEQQATVVTTGQAELSGLTAEQQTFVGQIIAAAAEEDDGDDGDDGDDDEGADDESPAVAFAYTAALAVAGVAAML